MVPVFNRNRELHREGLSRNIFKYEKTVATCKEEFVSTITIIHWIYLWKKCRYWFWHVIATLPCLSGLCVKETVRNQLSNTGQDSLGHPTVSSTFPLLALWGTECCHRAKLCQTKGMSDFIMKEKTARYLGVKLHRFILNTLKWGRCVYLLENLRFWARLWALTTKSDMM